MPIKLAIVGLPQLASDLIAEAFGNDDRVEITSLPSGTTVDVENISGRHEVVIVGVGDPWDSALLDRVSRLSQPTLFGVRTDGRESWLYRMRLCPEPLGPMSPRQIRTAVLAGQDPSA